MSLMEKVRDTATFMRKAWALSRPYFDSEEKWKARGLLLAIVVLQLAAVYMLVLLNDWNRLFYDALQNKDQEVFWEQLGRFTYLAFAYIIIAVYKFYLTQLIEMRWREWLTKRYLQRWLSGNAFYRMELARFSKGETPPDNPDQRIQEDLNLFTSYTVSLTMGLLGAVVTLVSFVGILWGLSGPFAFTLGGDSYSIPGFMVWMAVLYCAAGSLAAHYIGRPQIKLNFLQQRYEADFRHHMVRVREYSESIALDRGQNVERQHLDGRFATLLGNYLQLLKKQKNLVWFTNFFGQAAVVFPFIVAAPRFFSGAIQLGQLMQIASAFGRVQDSLSWFVDNYSSLAAWRATTDRLTSFEESLAKEASAKSGLHTEESATLHVRRLDVNLPGGQPLLAGIDLDVAAGDSILLEGPSGSGKSTLFRTLSGIWPHAQGEVARPPDAMFIPQRPYFPDGTLRDALAYPEPAGRYSDEALQQALHDALLPHLVGKLDEQDSWGQKLSGGEQQRLSIARVLLRKPRWIFADEATSALDESAERTVYGKLLAQVRAAGGAIVSIAHRPSVAGFHAQRWTLRRTPTESGPLYQLSASASASA